MTRVWVAWVATVLISFGIFEWFGYKRYGTKGTLHVVLSRVDGDVP